MQGVIKSYDPGTGEGVLVRDTDRSEYDLAPDALVGSIFILARLSESETRLSSEGGGAKLALATSSPGIVLAVLGTILMVVTLTIDFTFTSLGRWETRTSLRRGGRLSRGESTSWSTARGTVKR